MVEASMVLPLLILILLSLILLITHEYEVHRAQMKIHAELIAVWDQSSSTFDIKTKDTETSTNVDGAVSTWLYHENESRIYVFSPTECIRLGEMIGFGEE